MNNLKIFKYNIIWYIKHLLIFLLFYKILVLNEI